MRRAVSSAASKAATTCPRWGAASLRTCACWPESDSRLAGRGRRVQRAGTRA
ncbi:hypothetical protein [Burkholderia cenocepacia]|uniref:hypothetical protein n=1 Tax=Burkholderia cenocepacia TaxID=95486 RepID=UPI003D806111